MIPVTVAAVDSKGMSRDELSNFVSGTLMNKLEGTTGVASISQAGVLEKKVNVVLSQKKIDKINNKILASVNSKLADAQSQLDEQKAKIEKGQAQVAAAQEKLDAAKAQMPAEMFTQQFGTQQEKLTATSKQLTSAMTSLTTILGLIVMAIGKTAGTDMMQPVAVVCIGGLLYATLLTLFIVSIMYDLMNGEKYKVLKEEDLEVPAMGDAAY